MGDLQGITLGAIKINIYILLCSSSRIIKKTILI